MPCISITYEIADTQPHTTAANREENGSGVTRWENSDDMTALTRRPSRPQGAWAVARLVTGGFRANTLIVIEFDEDAVDIQNIGDDDDTSNSVPSSESSMPNAAEASESKKAKNGPKPRNRKKAKSSLDEVIDILKAYQATNSAVGMSINKFIYRCIDF